MLRVAVTGGAGGGKSAVAAMLRDLGAQVSQSDEVGRALMQPGQPAFTGIVAKFGEGVLAPDGTLDRAALARLAFQQGRLEELNSIVHPLVIAEQARWSDAIAASNPAAVAVVESALVFETRHAGTDGQPWRKRFDRIAVVTAPLHLRRERWIDRGGSGEDFDRRTAAQWPDEQKAALADVVVVNDSSLEVLREQVVRLWEAWKAESAERGVRSM